MSLLLALVLVLALPGLAQTNCASGTTPAYSACELAIDLVAQESPRQADVRAEFRSPKHKTYLIRPFVEGARLIFRFAPTEAGVWDYQLTGNLPRLEGRTGHVTAVESDAPGFVQVANVHHFITGDIATNQQRPHLWIGSALDHFAALALHSTIASNIIEQKGYLKTGYSRFPDIWPRHLHFIHLIMCQCY